MVNESGNADASAGEEATLSAAVESLCARRRRCPRAHGPRARLGRGARPASRGEYVCRRARRGRVGSCIGGLCCFPRPFSVCHPHGYRTRFFFDAYHPRRPSSACYHR
jgi:hypothetical protein